MRRLPVALAALLPFVLAGCSGTEGYGGIQRIDTNAHTITLYSGNTYLFDPGVDLSKWKVGDDVGIAYSYDPATKKNKATAISAYRS